MAEHCYFLLSRNFPEKIYKKKFGILKKYIMFTVQYPID